MHLYRVVVSCLLFIYIGCLLFPCMVLLAAGIGVGAVESS